MLLSPGTITDDIRPREAAVAIVNYVNHRNPNVSLLALNVSSSTKSPETCELTFI